MVNSLHVSVLVLSLRGPREGGGVVTGPGITANISLRKRHSLAGREGRREEGREGGKEGERGVREVRREGVKEVTERGDERGEEEGWRREWGERGEMVTWGRGGRKREREDRKSRHMWKKGSTQLRRKEGNRNQ